MAEQEAKEIASEKESFQQWQDLFAALEKDYREAYFNIEKAIKMDEDGKTNDAISLYEYGLSMIDKALEIPICEPAKPDINWEKTLAMTQKLRKTRKEILIRIENLNKKPEPKAGELPPSYEDVVSETGLMSGVNGVGDNGNNLQLTGTSKIDEPYISPSMAQDPLLLANLHVTDGENAISQSTDLAQGVNDMTLAKNEEILLRCNNVTLYFIAPDGRVSSTHEPNILVIARLHDETAQMLDKVLHKIVSDLRTENNERHHKKKYNKHIKMHRRKHYHKKGEKLENESTFLQVGSFVYPLIPEVSPCIRSEHGAFILPDVTSDVPGAAIGIIVPDDKHNEVHEMFTTILNGDDFKGVSKGGRIRRSVASGYSSKLVRGATYLANSLVRGAGTTARFIDTSTPMVIDKISPKVQPSEIGSDIQKTVEVAKTISGKAANVTDYLATKIGLATSALGRYLSPHIQKHGPKLLSSAINMPEEEASKKISSIIDAASNAAEGISIVYGGLETAASILARSLSSNTVQIIEHKYGQDAGVLTSNAFETVGNMYHTYHNARILKPKGFTKAAIKGAGSAILEDYRNSKWNPQPHDEFRGSGPGAGAGFLPSA